MPVALNRFGVVQLGGLNPAAAAVEAGIKIENILNQHGGRIA
ncbi:hypothetical protein ACFLT4_06130 [Chloroflexota bacterium]